MSPDDVAPRQPPVTTWLPPGKPHGQHLNTHVMSHDDVAHQVRKTHHCQVTGMSLGLRLIYDWTRGWAHGHAELFTGQQPF
ncbi:hypothetical protein LIER_04573 [Lithospermum erythrorhizon]|uniref:Uncharacterized protein n=1 Tax=Lithospermum erythrorhizon TaxID=34254 RepID=A0AAV3NX74_LITER